MAVIAVLDAPSNLGLRPPRPGAEPGVRGLASALRAQRIVERLGAADSGAVLPPAYSPDREPSTGFRNGPALASYSKELAERIGALVDADAFPLVLGGDCSILLGPMLALRRRGRYGLAHIDGHNDYSYARDYDRYFGLFTAAGLDLALASGQGPDALSDIDGLRPYVGERDIAQIGLQYEPEDLALFRTELFDTSEIRTFPAADIHQRGAAGPAADARALLEHPDLAGFWIHLDVDVLHKEVMPAVDSPNPNGLSFDQLGTVLTTLIASPRAMGMHVAIYDPELDPDGAAGANLVDTLVSAVLAGFDSR